MVFLDEEKGWTEILSFKSIYQITSKYTWPNIFEKGH